MKRIGIFFCVACVMTTFGAINAEWKNCRYSNTEQKKVFDAFFDYFITVDPGPGRMLNPKCDIDVLCTEKNGVSEAFFSADCAVLNAEGDQVDAAKMKPTGERYKFSKTVAYKKGSKPYLKD